MIEPVVLTVKATGRTVIYEAAGDPTVVTVPVAQVTETARPGRKAATHFDGYPAMKVTCPGLVNAFPDGSMEPTIQALFTIAHPGPATPPPVITIHGDTIPPQVARVPFLVTGFEWGDVIRRDDGARSRQAFTLELTEVVDASVQIRVKKQPAPARLVAAKTGETVRRFCARVLRSQTKATLDRVIALNGGWAKKGRYDMVIPKGKRVRVPA